MNSKLAILDKPEQGPALINIGVTPKTFKGRACIITLGCAKNRVDSEVMLGTLAKGGFELVNEPSEAEVIVVNTCGFLQSSVQESVDRILDAAQFKEKGRCRQLLVAGCLVERYRSELEKSIPEVDDFVTVDDILKIGDIAQGNFDSVLDRASRPYFLYDDTMPRCLSTAKHSAFVKVSEGCDRPCTFCIIPRLRGAMRSRSLDSVVKEVLDLAATGVKEINYVAQDLTAYGSDIRGPKFAKLLEAVDATKAVAWQRLLYAYPLGVDEELLSTIQGLPSVVEYLDIPLQHSSESVLKAMKRPLGKFTPRNLVEKIKNFAPGIHIRTTFIVGFPGETDKDIDDLEEFIRQGHFTNLGIFEYSRELGTPAHDLKGQVSAKAKKERRERLMIAQQEVVSARLESFVDQEIEVLIEGPHTDTELLLTGRARFQAPEIDGTVIINDIAQGVNITAGTIGKVKITEVAGYDLVGVLQST